MGEENIRPQPGWAASIGNSQCRTEVVYRKGLLGLAALLDYSVDGNADGDDLPWPQDALPPFAHWLNSNPIASQSLLGEDGHPRRGSFLPAFGFPRRMWAGSRVQRLGNYGVDQAMEHTTTIEAITQKSGRSGEMVFVTLRHQFFVHQQLVVQEDQDLVYRAAAVEPLPEPQIKAAAEILGDYDYDWYRLIQPDPTLLFRYSAVTFNGHRIHYDREYARTVEHYPGLVVQGPLTATMLLDLYHRECPQQRVSAFEFRGLSPLYDRYPFYLMGQACSDGADLWAVGPDGKKAMQMRVMVDTSTT